MCGYFCIRFIDFMIKGKSLLEYTKEYKKNNKIISKYFQYLKSSFLWMDIKKTSMKKNYFTNCKKYKQLKKFKISYICCKTLLLSSFWTKRGSEDEKIIKE